MLMFSQLESLGSSQLLLQLKGDIMQETLLRRPQVEARTGLSRSTIYFWMKNGNFPLPVRLGERLVAWKESEINTWLDGRNKRQP